jgi:predicted transcriptional regulator
VPVVGPIESLQELGFSEIESRVYLALLTGEPQTGYQAARAAAVQRPNVYPALERLERRGAVVRVPGPTGGVLYAAVPFERLARQIERAHRGHVEAVRRALAQLPAPTRGELPPTTLAQGYAGLVGALREMSGQARSSLVVALCPAEAAAVGDHLSQALGRGVRVGVVCLTACEAPCGHCPGDLVRVPVAPAAADPSGGRRWVVALRDGEEALAGEVAAGGSTALRTRQPVLMALAAGFLGYVAGRGGADGSGLGSAEALLAQIVQHGEAPAEELPFPRGGD